MAHLRHAVQLRVHQFEQATPSGAGSLAALARAGLPDAERDVQNHGDIIALHQCTLNDIQYGEIYAVVLDTIRTIKILRRSPDPDKLRFISINTNDYDEQEFDK